MPRRHRGRLTAGHSVLGEAPGLALPRGRELGRAVSRRSVCVQCLVRKGLLCLLRRGADLTGEAQHVAEVGLWRCPFPVVPCVIYGGKAFGCRRWYSPPGVGEIVAVTVRPATASPTPVPARLPALWPGC